MGVADHITEICFQTHFIDTIVEVSVVVALLKSFNELAYFFRSVEIFHVAFDVVKKL